MGRGGGGGNILVSRLFSISVVAMVFSIPCICNKKCTHLKVPQENELVVMLYVLCFALQ